MGIATGIEWCDSTNNLQMGCDGCELWNRKKGILNCYAGKQTDRYGGKNKGFPEVFEKPKLFLDRIEMALKWKDLTGTQRLGSDPKPWLDGLPRIIFLNDMGDTFTESLDRDWLAPLLPRMAASPHQWLLLTKRAKRLVEFSKLHPLPPNVWPGVSVTSQGTAARAAILQDVQGGGPKWISAEPLLSPLSLRRVIHNGRSLDLLEGENRIRWVIAGGESGGTEARPSHETWFFRLLQECLFAECPFFFKQWGFYAPEPIAELARIRIDLKGREIPLSDPEDKTHCLLKTYPKLDAPALLRGKTWRMMPTLTH